MLMAYLLTKYETVQHSVVDGSEAPIALPIAYRFPVVFGRGSSQHCIVRQFWYVPELRNSVVF